MSENRSVTGEPAVMRPQADARRTMNRVLIVEDEMLVAMLLEDMLGELGYRVAGCKHSLDSALAFSKEGAFDCAVLDVNLNGRLSFPIARVLRERNIPFIFASGYGAAGVDEQFKAVQVLSKPFTIEEIGRSLSTALHH